MRTELVYNRKKRLNIEGNAPIEVMIYLNRKKRIYRSTGILISPIYWDEKNKRLKKSYPDYDTAIKQIVLKRHSLEKKVIKNALAGDFSSANIDSQKISLFTYFDERVIKVSNSGLSEGTQYIYKRTLRYLKQFRNEDINIVTVDTFFLESFNIFLKNKKNLSLNTRASLLQKLKKVFNVAVGDGIVQYHKNPFNNFKINSVAPEVHSLTLKELRKIENLDMSFRPELEKTRDMFLFSCYTSLRFSDLINLSYENFEVLPGGEIRLSYIQEKLRHKTFKKIEWIITDFWNGKADAIVLKYFERFKDVRNTPKDVRYFFRYTNQFYNRQLKELQAFAGIKQELYSHLARHTCITLLVNDFGLDITKAQMIAGHSKIEMTRKYLRVTERDLQESAKRINWNI